MIQPYQQLKLIHFAKAIDASSENTSLFSFCKKSFSQQIIELKNAKKMASENTRNSYSLPLYNTVLMKIIELVGENKYLLKDPALIEFERCKLLKHNTWLDEYYEKYFNKYNRTPNTHTILNLIKNEVCSQIPFLKSFKVLPPERITEKKLLANAGYSMKNEVIKWLDSPVDYHNNESFRSVIATQVTDFLRWADTHPKAASYLVSDIALTCSVLLQKDASEKLMTSINAMVFTKLFLDALGLSPEYEPIENEKMLKFRALSDLVSYLPMVATGYVIVKKTTQGEYTSFLGLAIDIIKESSITTAAQTTTRLIPKGHEQVAQLLISVIRGKEFQEILAVQRYSSLCQMIGGVKAIVTNHSIFFIGAEIWWKTVFESTGMEKKKRIIVQLILPSIALCLLTSTVITAFSASLLISVTAFSVNIVASMILLNLSFFLTGVIDASEGSKIKNEVTQRIKKREDNQELLRASHFLLTNERKREEIKTQVNIYIEDLQKRYALPKIPESHNEVKASLSENELIEKLKKERFLKLKLKVEMHKGPLIPSDIIFFFNEVVNLKKMREKVTISNEASKDCIIFSVVKSLISEWLQVHLEQAFREKFLSLYYKDKEAFLEEIRQKEGEINDYLETMMERKLIDESSPLDLTDNKSILKNLKEQRILGLIR